MDFRQRARHALERARCELKSGDNERLKYAALELRMAMEALTYDRARAFKDEIPPSEYGKWQPKKLLQVLLEIEPTADRDSNIAIRAETAAGEPGEICMTGSERVLNLSTIKAHYDALGSFLHLPTFDKASSFGDRKPFDDLRAHCERVAVEIDKALSSSVYNITIGHFSSKNCDHCGSVIRKRVPVEATKVVAQCFSCSASYELVSQEASKQVEWVALVRTFKCRSEGCTESFAVWRGQLRVGTAWQCPGCKSVYGVDFGLVPISTP